MHRLGGVNRGYALLAGTVLLSIWLWVASGRLYSFTYHSIGTLFSNKPQSTSENDIFDFPLVDSQAVRDVCSMTDWNSSLIFTCDNNHGGVGHVRNSILNCVRYAIAAGGSLVLPNIALRDHHDMMDLHVERRHGPGRKGMGFMFDEKHFIDSLKLSCPELKLIKHMEASANGRRRGLQPESLFNNHPTSGLEHPEQWPTRLENWISHHMSPYPKSVPIVIDLEQSFLQYPTHSDSHEFAHTFGNILKFRQDVRLLATTTLHTISRTYDLPLNIPDAIIANSIFGAHLRTEEDPMEKRHLSPAPYAHYEGQSKAYLEEAALMNATVLYAASGSVRELSRLAIDALDYNVEVNHKFELLKGRDREMLEMLKWDQMALVDYLVLLKVQDFAGIGHSSFSWNLALKRHEHAHRKGSVHEDQLWSDGRSSLYGVRKGYVESAACMWP